MGCWGEGGRKVVTHASFIHAMEHENDTSLFDRVGDSQDTSRAAEIRALLKKQVFADPLPKEDFLSALVTIGFSREVAENRYEWTEILRSEALEAQAKDRAELNASAKVEAASSILSEMSAKIQKALSEVTETEKRVNELIAQIHRLRDELDMGIEEIGSIDDRLSGNLDELLLLANHMAVSKEQFTDVFTALVDWHENEQPQGAAEPRLWGRKMPDHAARKK